MKTDLPDVRDDRYVLTKVSLGPAVSALPEEVNFQAEMPHVHNQGARQSCAVYATTTCLEHKLGKVLSPAFATWAAAQEHHPVANGIQYQMYVTSLRDALKTLQHVGTCEERYYNDDAPLNKIPPAHCWHLTHRAKRYSAVQPPSDGDALWWLRYIVQYHVSIAVSVTLTLDAHAPDMWGKASTGTFAARAATGAHLLKPDESSPWGMHALVICGYKPGYWRVLNSWSRYWGDKGYAWLPWEYTLYDAWTVTEAE